MNEWAQAVESAKEISPGATAPTKSRVLVFGVRRDGDRPPRRTLLFSYSIALDETLVGGTPIISLGFADLAGYDYVTIVRASDAKTSEGDSRGFR